MRATVLAGILAMVSAVGLQAQQAPATTARSIEGALEVKARQAATAAEHAGVAMQYRLRAESIEAELAALDAQIRARPQEPRSGVAAKWPAMNPSPSNALRRRAMDLRQAAAEARRAQARHVELAVERGFATATAGQ